MRRGFTLIELMVVMAIIATLMAIVAPRYFEHLHRAKESALRETLHVVRDAIDKFHGDTGRYPDSLEEMVERRYLRSLPTDPLTESTSTWDLRPPPSDTLGKVYDLRSGAPGNSRTGTPYAEL